MSGNEDTRIIHCLVLLVEYPGFSVSLLGVATTQENDTKAVKVFEI